MAADDDGQVEEPAELLAEVVEEVVDALSLDGDVTVEERDDGALVATVSGEGLGLLIGRHGQTIDAVQHLAQRIVFSDRVSAQRVVVDVDGYRDRRRQNVEADALDAAERAVRTGRPVVMAAMPPSERRVAHEFLRDRDDVTTQSEGEGSERRLVVSPVD